MSIPRFFVSKDEIKGDFASITDKETLKHIKALRLRTKEKIILLDGDSEYDAQIEAYLSGCVRA
ncbi:MAG: hypothetical protein QME07_06425, partial [bacterium]|nr:hypothetical protein [bacterium]